MTEKQLSDIGFYKEGHNSVYHSATDITISVGDIKKLKLADLIEKYGNSMFESGKVYGKKLKTEEIKEVLDI